MTSNAAGLNRPSEAHFRHSNADVKTLEESGGMPIAHGEGIYVFDLDGNRYFEAISGTWHLAFGFSEQRLTDAVNAQMARLPAYHAFFGRVGEPVLHLADRLSKIAPMPTGKVFFSHSGSEANETAIKMLWLINWAKGQPAKRKVIHASAPITAAPCLRQVFPAETTFKPSGCPSTKFCSPTSRTTGVMRNTDRAKRTTRPAWPGA